MVALTSTVATQEIEQEALLGRHRLLIHSPGGALPVHLAISAAKDSLHAELINGREHIAIPRVTLGDVLRLEFPHYDSEIELGWSTESGLSGQWIKRRGSGKTTRMAVRSDRLSRRFTARTASDEPARDKAAEVAAFAGRFAVRFSSSQDPAVAIFELSDDTAGPTVHGTFLTTLGDYRFLAGNLVGDDLWLSCFDGAHAFLFRARAADDGSIRGDFWSSDNWHESWTAKRDDGAALPDGFALSTAREGSSLSTVKVRDLTGKTRALDDPAWQGHPRVVELFGSWCPNCHDHGAYLAELHRRYRDRGLVVLGIAFEHDEDFPRSAQQVAHFRDRHRIEYPVFVAGLSDKAKATQQLGVLDEVRAFPTTLFLDRHGRIRHVYQGWTGPAAAADHRRLRDRFESLIEELLAER